MTDLVGAVAAHIEELIEPAWVVEIEGSGHSIIAIRNTRRQEAEGSTVVLVWSGSSIFIRYHLIHTQRQTSDRYWLTREFDISTANGLDELLTTVERICSYKLHNEPQ